MTPTPNEADRHFLAYQETGAPRHLARVFDLVAGELLMLASHLSRDPHTAEDLVQTTFLEAIKCAKRFELKSGVKQWLVGILANHARLEWRRRGRKLDPERVRSERAVDPDFEVEAREFTKSLGEAMAGLPPKYREVLRLSLFHDLSTAEIAQAVDRPRETVKSQVRRGMQMLQKAMPSSLALGALVTMTTGRGLAAMKMTILAKAEAVQAAANAAAAEAAAEAAHATAEAANTAAAAAHATAEAATAAARVAAAGLDPAAGFGTWAAWGSTAKKLMAVAALGVLAVGAWHLWPDPAVVEDVNPAPGGGVQAAGAGGSAGAGAVPGQRTPLTVKGAAGATGEGVLPDKTVTGSLLVRVRFASDQAPAAGAVVSVRRSGETTWLGDKVQRTVHEGAVAFEGLEPGDVQIFAGRGGAAEATVVAGRQVQAELWIPPGIDLRGVVKDKGQKPLAGVAICLAPPHHGLDFGVEVTRSDAAGAFHIRDVEPLRGIAAYLPGRVGPRPLYLHGRAGSPGEVVLQFRGPAAAIRGVVRGPDGKPAVGAAVMIGWSFAPKLGDDLACYPLRTDERGAFFAPGVVTAYDLPVWVKGVSPTTAVWRGNVSSMDPGEEAFVQVDLKRGAGVRGVVRRSSEAVVSKSGDTVAGKNADKVAGKSGDAVAGRNGDTLADKNGDAVAGRNGDTLADKNGDAVAGEDRETVAGMLVEALQDNVEEGPGFKFSGPVWARVQTRSAADGSFVLSNIQPGGGKLSAGDAERPELGHARQAFRLRDGEELQWNPILGRGHSILGRVVDQRGVPIPDFRVKLQGPKHTEDRIVYSNADGTFVFDALEDIPYVLTMAEKNPVIPHLAVFFEDVRPGSEVVDFPIGDCARASCTLTGTMVGPAGLPVEGLRISLIHEQDGTRKGAEARGFEYRHGRFRVGPLPPAVYHLYGQAGNLGMVYAGRFEALSAGQTVDVGTVQFREPGSLSLRVKDPDGRPTARPFLEITAEGSPAGTRVVLKGGRCDRHPLAPGVYWLSYWSHRHLPCFRRVEVASGQEAKVDIQFQEGLEVLLRLPPVPVVGTALTRALYRARDARGPDSEQPGAEESDSQEPGAKAPGGAGRLVFREQRIYGHVARPGHERVALAPGRYCMVVTNVAGVSAETRFTVSLETAEERRVDVRFPD